MTDEEQTTPTPLSREQFMRAAAIALIGTAVDERYIDERLASVIADEIWYELLQTNQQEHP
jgi:hypothetical protein